jgi:hypothetical protein
MNQVFRSMVRVVVNGDELDVDDLKDYLVDAVSVSVDTEECGQPDGAEVVVVELDWERLERVPVGFVSDDLMGVAREFVEDVRSVGVRELEREWPDLAVTYYKFVQLLGL